MTTNAFGRENSTWGGGQTHLEMEPRKWYAVPAGTTIENQFPRPLLLSEVDVSLAACVDNPVPSEYRGYGDASDPCGGSPLAPYDEQASGIQWPSPHFRAEHSFHTILAGEKITLCADAFISSTHWRIQPISVGLIGSHKTEITGAMEVEIPDITIPPIEIPEQEPEGFLRVVPVYDDVNGDGSLIVKFYQATRVVVDGATVTTTDLGSFSDELMSGPYSPFSPVAIDDVNNPVVATQLMKIIDGETWSPTSFTKGYTVRVISIADPANPPTFTDSDGVTTPLEVTEVFTYEYINSIFDIDSIVTAQAGDKVKITYLEARE